MTRSVPEWRGKTDDTPVPDRVKLRIWRRQCGEQNFAICPLSGLPIRATDEKHLDHIKALIEQGEHRESNLVFVHVSPHRRKTAEEQERRARNDARAKSHAGISTAPTIKIQSAGFKKSAKAAKRVPKTPCERKRGMFE